MKSGGFLTTNAAVVMRPSRYRGLGRVAGRILFLLTFILASPLAANALALRTFVASNGMDANTATNCPVTAPCQTFAAAYSVTGVGGEIIALDSAGYGPVTITNSVSIIGIHRAFVKPTPSTTGITINAGAGNTVILDNIEVNGAGGASTTGIALNSGRLILQNSVLTRLTTGLTISSTKADIINTNIISNQTGIFTSGSGVDPTVNPNVFSGVTQARLYASNVMANATAFFMQNPGVASAGALSNITILLFSGGDQNNRVIGNTMLVNGSGTGCPSGALNISTVVQCDKIITFSTPLFNETNTL